MIKIPKTVGDLKAILEGIDDDTPVLLNRGNQTFEAMNAFTKPALKTLNRIDSKSKVHIEAARASFPLRSRPKTFLTIG